MKLYKRMLESKDIDVPWESWRFFGKQSQSIGMAGDQASLGEDYGTLSELRVAFEWYVDQLGGKVKWED